MSAVPLNQDVRIWGNKQPLPGTTGEVKKLTQREARDFAYDDQLVTDDAESSDSQAEGSYVTYVD